MSTKSCMLIPRKKDAKGVLHDSKLFTSLLDFCNNNYLKAQSLYLKSKNKDFLKKYSHELIFDDLNEPTIESLWQNHVFRKEIKETDLLQKLRTEIGVYHKKDNTIKYYQNTIDEVLEVQQKAIDFNDRSPFKDDYIAIVKKTINTKTGKENFYLSIEKRTLKNTQDSLLMKKNFLIYKQIISILKNFGVKIEVIDNLRQRIGANGETEFKISEQIANGIETIIRLSNDEKGLEALPEEFAHFCIECLGSNAIKERLLNLIISKNLLPQIFGEQYEQYKQLYNKDTNKLATEALGKLLTEHFFKNEPIKQNEYKTLLSRFINQIKNFFKQIKQGLFPKTIDEVNKHLDTIQNLIFNSSENKEMSLSNIKTNNKYYQLENDLKKEAKILDIIIEKNVKRLKLIEFKYKKGQKDLRTRQFLNELLNNLNKEHFEQGVYTFLQEVVKDIRKITLEMDQKKFVPTQEIASWLRANIEILQIYESIFKDINEIVLPNKAQYAYAKSIIQIQSDLNVLLTELNIHAKTVFKTFFKQYGKETYTIPFGKYKGKVFSLDELLDMALTDINFFDRYFNSASDSLNPIITIFSKIIKEAQETARLETLNVAKEIEEANALLNDQDTSWMYERDENGKLTGLYISELKISQFKKDYSDFLTSLTKKYGKYPIGEQQVLKEQERLTWLHEHTEQIGDERKPKKSLYENEKFKSLSDKQKQYYHKVIEIKKKLDALLPNGSTNTLNVIKIFKNSREISQTTTSTIKSVLLPITSTVKRIKNVVKYLFQTNPEDEDLYQGNFGIYDINGEKVQSIPIFYLRLKSKDDLDKISTDMSSTLTLYATMALQYKNLNEVVDLLEISKKVIDDKDVTVDGKFERIKFFSYIKEKLVAKKNKSEYVKQRIDDLFAQQLYHRYYKNADKFINSPLNPYKIIQLINSGSAIVNLSFNLLQAISNVLTGNHMMNVEAITRRFFSHKDMLFADKEYLAHAPAFLAEVGVNVKTSKLSLFDELFHVTDQTDTRMRKFGIKTRLGHLFSANTLSFLQSGGEHWMHIRTALALAHQYKLLDANGKEVNLWKALTVKQNSNKNRAGAKLIIPEGYTKLDGTAFTQKDIIEFTLKIQKINHSMHGIYNEEDRIAIKQTMIGQLIMLYKNWIPSNFNKLWGRARYDFSTDMATEGYYRTTFRFLKHLAQDLVKAKLDIVTSWKDLTKEEQSNIRGALLSSAHLIMLMLLLGFTSRFKIKDLPWEEKVAIYQINRLYSEIGFLTPGIQMPNSVLQIFKEPIAAVRFAETQLELLRLIIDPKVYTKILQSGQYKGHSEAYKIIHNALPFHKSIYRSIHPEEAINFYKRN